MQPSKAIHTGTLPSGIPYYLAVGNAERGLADFTLLCDTACAPQPRKTLSELPHFPAGAARFLAGHGSRPNPEGWISCRDGAALFRFPSVHLSSDAVRDSTFLLLFDLIAATPGGNHALIVAGDIDPEACKTAMHYLSLQLAAAAPQEFPDRYSWTPVDTATLVRKPLSPGANPALELTWRLPRIARSRLRTIQPYVSALYAHTLGHVLSRRIRTVCLSEHIPYGEIDCSYRPTSEGAGDERFTLRVSTDSLHVGRMLEVMAETLSAVDRNGVLMNEYNDGTRRIRDRVERMTARGSNAYLTQRCIAASLYGSDLADVGAISRFLSTRKVNPDRESKLFNSFTSALLDSAANLTLTVSGGSDDDLMARFRESWGRRDTYIHTYANAGSYTGNLSVEPVKVKCRKVSAEPVSGGELWQLSNGMQVVFKRTSGEPGRFRYGWLLRGGYPEVQDLAPGEGAFVGDMLRLSFVGSLLGMDFYNMLEAHRIELEPSVSMQDLRLTGCAPTEELELLLRSLLELACRRKVDRKAFESYRENEALHIAEGDPVEAALWKAIRPADFRYSDRKEIGNLTDSLPEKAARYFDSRFADYQEGVLVLIGDLDPEYTKLLLCRWLGALGTTPVRGKASNLSRIAYQPHAGTLTLYRQAGNGNPGSCSFLMQAPMLYTAKNTHAVSMAGLYLSDFLTRELTPLGLRCEVRTGFTSYPEGWVDVRIDALPVAEVHWPEGIAPVEPMAAAASLRSALRKAAATEVSPEMMAFYRSYWEDQVTARLTGEATLVDAVLKRYGEGKDIISGYRQQIGAVSAADIAQVLKAVAEGVRVEYILEP